MAPAGRNGSSSDSLLFRGENAGESWSRNAPNFFAARSGSLARSSSSSSASSISAVSVTCPLAFALRHSLQRGRQRFQGCRVPREQSMNFYVENESVRRRLAPSPNESRIRKGVETGIDFDHVKVLRIPRQTIARGKLRWIPALDKTGIRPARRPDEDPSRVG